MAQEGADGVFLPFRKIAVVVLDVLELRHVPEERLGVNQILVHIVEVPEHDVSPEDKLIQGFRLSVMCGIYGIKRCKKAETVTYLSPVQAAEKIVYCVHGGNGHRCSVSIIPHHLCQVFPEKHHGASVGEYKARILYVLTLEIMPGHLPQKGFHYLITMSYGIRA